ncbi:MAG: DUF2911 domain-containing protein [Planctomycetes bacterium]|nr:DUF2911 domain-containing protein [Planctomycetota bacterium]
MKHSLLSLAIAAIASAALAPSLLARTPQTPPLEFPQASPAATLKQRIGLTDVEITYSRPAKRGRPLFGALVPYGELWRTGANAATKISFSTDVKWNGVRVPAGSYALFTIPDRTEWTVILNKVPDQSGTSTYDEAQDLNRVQVKPTVLSTPVENFRIDVDRIVGGSGVLSLAWDTTSVSVTIDTDVVALLLPKIQAAMAAEGKKPWYQAAWFYYENDLDPKQAAAWMAEAVKERPDTVWMVHRQALILKKAGDLAGARAAAQRSLELAAKAGGALGAEYKRLNEELLASLK